MVSGVGHVTVLSKAETMLELNAYSSVSFINGNFVVRARSLRPPKRSDVFPSTAREKKTSVPFLFCVFLSTNFKTTSTNFDSACLVCSNYINMQFSF